MPSPMKRKMYFGFATSPAKKERASTRSSNAEILDFMGSVLIGCVSYWGIEMVAGSLLRRL